MHERLRQGLRLEDTGQRILAFYLTEMEERRLHQATGHSSTVHYAECRLELSRRRARELIAVGRKLLDLPSIDRAFCEGRLGWSKVLLLVRVASPEHEDAWLERALALTCRELALEVRLSKPGAAPRKPGEHKGLPEVRFKVAASVGVLTHQKLELAKQKLSAERGYPADDAELLDVLSELFLNLEEDGSVPGRTRVDASLYRVVLRPGGSPDDDEALSVDTADGPIPVHGAGCLCCDAEHVDADGEPDGKTPPALRRKVIARDGGRCRCCGSRHRLMVHHIVFRSRGGKTIALNLITLCVSCHALVHADLLMIEGEDARSTRFVDRTGMHLHEPGRHVHPATLRRIAANETDPEPRGEPPPTELEPESEPDPGPTPLGAAFEGLIGQAALVERLVATAQGSLARSRSFPHTLFVGPAGTGKTTLATRLARCFGSRLLQTSGPMLKRVPDLVRLLAGLSDGDMLFVDEIHATPRVVLETLYEAMATRRISFTDTSGGHARAIVLALPPFTLVGATTEDGDLPHALRTRFGLHETLDFYEREDLAALVAVQARSEGFEMDAEGALRVAFNARGTPREALRLLDRVLDAGAARDRQQIDAASVANVLDGMGFDAEGLAPIEQRYLALLRSSKQPIAVGRLARMLGTSRKTLEKYVEPFLCRRGLVQMTSRGRAAITHGPGGERSPP